MVKLDRDTQKRARERVLALSIGGFVYVRIQVGEDTQQYDIGILHTGDIPRLMESARRNIPEKEISYEISHIGFVSGSRLADPNSPSSGGDRDAIAKILANDVMALTFNTSKK